MTPPASAAVSQLPTANLQPQSPQQAVGATSMPWLLVNPPSAAQFEIVYVAGDGVCVTPRGLSVQETGTSVIVAVLASTDPSRSACPDVLRLARSTVSLTADEAGLPLVHAEVDQAWSGADYFRTLTG